MIKHHILNLGAGVQSTALYLMSMERMVPHFDCAIFADTGEEPQAVYRHLEWVQSLGGPPILVRSVGSRLGDDLRYGMHPQGQGKARFTAIPAFTIIEGEKPGRTKRQCSMEYKGQVIERAIRREVLGLEPRRRVPKGVTVHQYFGISLDEKSRASRIWERYHVTGESKFQPHFPLIERGWTRANCIDWLQGRVPHEVPRSACVFCPFHTDAEWQKLKDRGGEDWSRAVEIDQVLRTTGAVANRDMRQTMYVHRSCKPIDEINFRSKMNVKEKQLGFDFGFDSECEGVCGV
ncbi:MAG TPA: hypothetical protein VI455_04160 [Terriglobia bacterium]